MAWIDAGRPDFAIRGISYNAPRVNVRNGWKADINQNVLHSDDKIIGQVVHEIGIIRCAVSNECISRDVLCVSLGARKRNCFLAMVPRCEQQHWSVREVVSLAVAALVFRCFSSDFSKNSWHDLLDVLGDTFAFHGISYSTLTKNCARPVRVRRPEKRGDHRSSAAANNVCNGWKAAISCGSPAS